MSHAALHAAEHGSLGMEYTQRLAAAGIASCALLAGSWFISNAQAAPVGDSCGKAIALAEQMANANGERMATMGARSAALRLGMDAKVEQLTPELDALHAKVHGLHREFRAAAADCR